MAVGAGKATDATEAVAAEEVVAGEQDVVAIRITTTTPGLVLTPDIFLGI